MAEQLQMPLIALRERAVFPKTSVAFDVGREKSKRAVRNAVGGTVFLVAQTDGSQKDYTPFSVYPIGVICKIDGSSPVNATTMRTVVTGVARARLVCAEEADGYYVCTVEKLPLISQSPDLEEAYFRTLKATLYSATQASSRLNKITQREVDEVTDGEALAYSICQKLGLPVEKQQTALAQDKLLDLYRLVEDYLSHEMEISRLERKINAAVKQSIEKNQKEYYLREQLKAIHTELGDDEEERDVLQKRIQDLHMPAEIEEKALKELSRMGRMATSSPDYNVLRTYLDWICDLPWNEYTQDTALLADAVKVLNADHYGLDKIKERIVEYLAVLKLTDGLNAPILCLVGPPGVGKTSIAESIARSLGRKFVRMSLGGVKDEAEIRGHRKTYIGAMPGRIINGIKNAGSCNPVFLLDEVDKLSSDMRGDPASALLEVLDPAQNATFRDRYMEVPFDLSRVLFITTANSLDTIPAPLRDRMEILSLEGYTLEEKTQIAKRYLIPKRRKANGLEDGEVSISDGALAEMIEGYTAEAGVRNLERAIDTVCRKIAVKKADGDNKKRKINESNLHKYLGTRRYSRNQGKENDEVGAATGLAWTAVGGTTLTIEVTTMPGKGEVLLTGKLGDVMKESARAALSYIRSKAQQYGVDPANFENTDIHVHVPEGATPKDGPSAGITMATAILSAFARKPVRHDVAMTGEITLRGKVLPIGGLKEKALAAYRLGIHTVIIPQDNAKDLEEIPENIRAKIHFIQVENADQVFQTAIVGLV